MDNLPEPTWKTGKPQTKDVNYPIVSPLLLVTVVVCDNRNHEKWRVVRMDRYNFDTNEWIDTSNQRELMEDWNEFVIAWCQPPKPYVHPTDKVIVK